MRAAAAYVLFFAHLIQVGTSVISFYDITFLIVVTKHAGTFRTSAFVREMC